MRYLATLLPVITLLSACSSQPKPAAAEPQGNPFHGDSSFILSPNHAHSAAPFGGDFADNQAANAFIDNMVAKHGFDRQQLHDILGQAKKLDWVIRLMDRQAPTPVTTPTQPVGPNGAWLRYRNKFITPDNVPNGVAFWNQYQKELQRAQQVYGVPPEIIVGIIGVETRWGRVMGKTRILDALATLAFSYPRRAEYFSSELETFLLMANEEGDDPLDLRGSYAGAMGYGQFMPSAFKQYAVDFNGDGHINLWDPVDAIGSVAHYFQAHGWQPGGTVAVPAQGQAPGLKNGFNTQYSVFSLTASGLSPSVRLNPEQKVSLLRLDMGTTYQYWYGLPNFYAITRYNHSTHYAMAVWQLGEAVRDAR